ncbi:MAG: outer membrane protein assembly factor BamB family protein, partial [Candidatus Kariarchaeaceae archaeon]
GNGFEELIVAGEEGNVYSYEVVNVYQSTTDLHYLKHLWTNDKALGQPKEPNLSNLVETFDVNNDDKLDIVYSSIGIGNPVVSLVDGATGLDLWTVNPSSAHNIFGPITSLKTDGDSLVLGFKTGQILVLSLSDGSFRWNTTTTGYPVLNSVYGNFIGSNVYSIAWATANEIVVRRADGSVIGQFMIGEAFLDSFFDIFPIVRSNGTGITDLGAIVETGRVEIFQLNPWNVTYYNQTYINGSLNGGTALGYDLSGDGLDELFFAANGLLFAFDSNGEMMWNTSDSSLDVELRDLRVIKENDFDKTHVIVTSKPAKIDFEDMIPEILDPNAVFPGGYDLLTNVSFYADRGVNFSSTFIGINTSILNLLNPVDYPASYYNASSGQIVALTIDTTDYLEFEEPQQYVSFKLDIYKEDQPNSWDLQIRGLDSSNKTVYVSEIIGNVADHDVFISLPSPMLKRIVFVGLKGISDKVAIDDLVIGGTTITAFDVEEGKRNWRYELLPAEELTIHEGTTTFYEDKSQLLTLGYKIHPIWESFFDAHKGSIALDISSGMPYYTANSDMHMHEVVSIGNSEFVVLFETSELASGGTITDRYYPEINYQAQNDAVWQVNTNRLFRTIDKGQLDPDQAQEMVITDGRFLLVAMDNNGDFLWKYRTKAPIRDIVLADFIQSGNTDQVAVLLGDGTLLLLDSNLGLPVSPNFPQYIQWYEILTGLAVDMNEDGKRDLIIGSGKSGNPVAGRVNFLTYNIATRKFDHLYPQVNVAGHVRELLPADFNGDGSVNDLAVLGYGYRITGFNSDSSPRGFHNDKVLTMVVGDIIADGRSEIYYANKNNETWVVDDLFAPLLIESSPILPKYSKIESLAIFDYNQDSALDIAIHYRAFGTTIKDPVNGNEAFWEDPAIFSTLSSTIDLDSDGYEDIVVTNDNLLYALSHSSPYLTNSPLPHWSTPISVSRIVTSLPVDVDGNGVDELVFMNIKGEIFAVKPINNPVSLMRPLVTSNVVDNNDWDVIGYFDELYEDDVLISELFEEIQNVEQAIQSIPHEFFLIFGLVGGISITLASIIIKNKKIFSRFLRKLPESDILVGGDK